MTYNVVALLPMKANSQRIKGKNFKTFSGKPLFRWMLDRLINETQIDKVIINTDARSILCKHNIVETDKLIIRDRKEEICGDEVSMNKIIEDDICSINARSYLMTHTTNPLLTAKSIRESIKLYKQGLIDGYDSLFTVNKFQTRFYDKNAIPINHDPLNLIQTQDLDPWYEENSNMYLFSKESFFKHKSRIGQTPLMFEINKFESCDIDNSSDWEFAELAFEFFTKKGFEL